MKPYKLSATKAIEQIKKGLLTATELAKSCIEQTEMMENKIHAWSIFNKQEFLMQAKSIDKQITNGTFKGCLYGIPVGIKDIYNTKYFPTEMGSPIWKDFTPGNDSRVVFYIKQEGGIVPGKTVTAEFAVHHPGPTVNPHNFKHTPGTSSSGSAAAVAASMIPVSIGSQTAGSSIRPASYCGIYGYKPTFGLIPRTGVLKTVDVLDHVTTFGRTIEDIELMFDVMRVKGDNFPYVHSILENERKQNKTGPWKIAFVKTHLWEKWEKYAKESIQDYVSKLSKLKDITIEEVELPKEFKLSHKIHKTIYNKALSYYYNEEYNNSKEMLSNVFKSMIEDGMKISKDEYTNALKEQVQLSDLMDSFFSRYDGIITLSTAGSAKKGLDSVDTIDSCLIWTLCGVPSINIPVFTCPKGLPYGAQIVFRKYRDYSLFSFLHQLKKNNLINDVSYDLLTN